MSKKRVLLVCYYFPPLGGAGVGRPLALFKQFPRFGYECHVLTVKPVAYRSYEPELLDGLDTRRIYRSGSYDPQRLMYLVGVRKVTDAAINRGKKLSNRFFPDPKIGWVRPAVKLGRVLAENRHYNFIISTSPPISIHLAAMKLAEEFDIPWIADFRDYWTGYKAENWFDRKRQIDRALSLLHDITDRASIVTAVNLAIVDYLQTGKAIFNGYDDERARSWTLPPDSRNFVIGVLGTLDELRPVEPLFKLLAALRKEAYRAFDKVRLLQVGQVNVAGFETLLDRYGLRDRTDLRGIRSRTDTIAILSQASLMYVGLSAPRENDIVPGRIFDMLASGRPIMAYVPKGSVIESLVKESGNGFCWTDDSLPGAVGYLRRQIELSGGKELLIRPLPPYATRFSAEKMVERFVDVMETL